MDVFIHSFSRAHFYIAASPSARAIHAPNSTQFIHPSIVHPPCYFLRIEWHSSTVVTFDMTFPKLFIWFFLFRCLNMFEDWFFWTETCILDWMIKKMICEVAFRMRAFPLGIATRNAIFWGILGKQWHRSSTTAPSWIEANFTAGGGLVNINEY